MKSGHTQPPPGVLTAIDAAPAWVRKAVPRGREVQLLVNGNAVPSFEGEAVAIALATAGCLTLRHSPKRNSPRGMFCLMGVCQECVVDIDGAMLPSCMTPARDGMHVTTDSLRRSQAAATATSPSEQIVK